MGATEGSRLWPEKPAPFGRKRAGFGRKSRLLSGQKPASAGSFRGAQRRSRLQPASARKSRLTPAPEAGSFGQKSRLLLARESRLWPEAGFPLGATGLEGLWLSVRHLLGRQAAHSAPERCCLEGRLEAASAESVENTLTAPNGKSRTLESLLFRGFLGGKSDGKAGFPPGRAENSRTGSTVGMFFRLFRKTDEPENSAFLDGKRGFLTEKCGILSVLFGGGIRSSEDRIPSCSGTPFWPALARSALFSPLIWPKPARSCPEKGRKVACFEPFLSLSDEKTCFSVLFRRTFAIQAAPLIGSREELLVTFHGKVTEKSRTDPSSNQPKSCRN